MANDIEKAHLVASSVYLWNCLGRKIVLKECKLPSFMPYVMSIS